MVQQATTEAGRDALGFYHEKKDEQRDVGLGSEHDWSSHCADAFGLMAIAYEDPSRLAAFSRPLDYVNRCQTGDILHDAVKTIPAETTKTRLPGDTEEQVRIILAMSTLALCTLCFNHTDAAIGLHPPCEGVSSSPAFAPPGHTPNYVVWANPDWTPPPCTGWTSKESVVVAVAGEFHFDGTMNDLLGRFGAISTLTKVRYWSARENDWRTLITNAAALRGANPANQRTDFTATEMRSGKDLFFRDTDNRSGEPVIYRMHVTARGESFVITIENISTVQKFLLQLISPGDLQSIHYLERIGPETWSYYALARTAKASLSAFGVVRNESYVNRALALYSHFTSIAVDPVTHIH